MGGRFIAVAKQVWNMLDYWPKKKLALLKGINRIFQEYK
jgi:hypothetical protein